MFSELKSTNRSGWTAALLLSCSLHGFVLLLLTHAPSARYVLPKEVALGTPYSSGSVIYLAPLGPEQSRDSQALEIAHVEKPKAAEPAKKKAVVERQREEPAQTAAVAPEVTAHGGSTYGEHIPGAPLTGQAVMPALPQVFPDPPVSRADLPPGVSGDVIVEVTIDEQGNVTEMKLTQGIGYGIDEKVLAILRQWRFRPATRNGVTIASQHLVHFHYPS